MLRVKEATGGFEPPNKGFADLRLKPLGYVAGSGRRDLNPRPSAWEADALPTELLPHGNGMRAEALIYPFRLAGPTERDESGGSHLPLPLGGTDGN